MNKPKIYTAADFGRYLSGAMPAAEMHELERRALHDPFVQDALDGYADHPYAAADTDILHDQLADRLLIKKKSYQPFFLLKIAAVLIVAASVSWFIYENNKNEQDTGAIASNTEKTSATENEQVATPKINQDAQIEDLTANPQTNAAKVDAPVVEKNKSVATENAAPAKTNALSKDVLEGKVVNTAGEPVAKAEIVDDNNKLLATTTDDGFFSITPAPDNNLEVTVKAKEYKEQEEVFKPEVSNNKVILAERNVATNAAPAMPNNNVGYSRKKNAVASVTPVRMATPVIGNEQYKQYIRNNYNAVTDTDGKKINGTIRLSFALNAEGKPQQVQVEKSLCSACDEQIIKLIQDGPAFTPGSSSRYILEISL